MSARLRANRRAKPRKTTIGSRRYAIAAGQRGTVRSKLTKKHLSLIKRRGAFRSTIDVTVVWEAVTFKKRITVTLKRPKRARR